MTDFKKKLAEMQSGMAHGIPDISKLAEFREREAFEKRRGQAASKCQEVVEISRMMIVEHPELDIETAISRAELFYLAASTYVDGVMEEFEEDESTPLVEQ